MTDKIEPALTPDEWTGLETWIPTASPGKQRYLYASFSAAGIQFREPGQWTFLTTARDLSKLIAAANAALPHSDPRKITRERMAAVRAALAQQHVDLTDDHFTSDETRVLAQVLDALESYLPPA